MQVVVGNVRQRVPILSLRPGRPFPQPSGHWLSAYARIGGRCGGASTAMIHRACSAAAGGVSSRCRLLFG